MCMDLETLTAAAKGGDGEALAALDAVGFLAGKDETPREFGERLELFRANAERMEKALNEEGSYELEDLQLEASSRVPSDILEEGCRKCKDIYGIEPSWVPAFFIDPKGSLLFGGCSYTMLPDFFAIFIIRRAFKDKCRWLIYDRDELLSHESCHVARSALLSEIYEETFAYQTSDSAFRRLAGGIMLHPSDSYALLGTAFLPLLAQIIRNFLLPSLWIWPFWLPLPLFVLWLILRYAAMRRRMAKATEILRTRFGDKASRALFRLTDDEIDYLACQGSFPPSMEANETARSIIFRQWLTENEPSLPCNSIESTENEA